MENMNFQNELLNLKDTLYLFSRKFTSIDAEREDLTQDTMLKAWTNQDKFQAGSNLKAWVYTIMRNLYISQFNKKKRYKIYTIDEKENEAFDYYFIDYQTPESTLYKKEFMSSIDNLDSHLKDPLTMYHEGFKYDEISEKLSIPVGTVKNRIFTARKAVRNELK